MESGVRGKQFKWKGKVSEMAYYAARVQQFLESRGQGPRTEQVEADAGDIVDAADTADATVDGKDYPMLARMLRGCWR